MVSFVGDSSIVNEGVATSFAAPKCKLVVKIGSSTLTRADGSADIDYLRALASQIARVRQAGWGAVIVTSGAIAVGLNKLGIDKRPTDMPSLQAAACLCASLCRVRPCHFVGLAHASRYCRSYGLPSRA